MSLNKLRGRSIGEFRERAEQAFAAWLERAGWRDSGEYSQSELAARLERTPADATHPVVHGPFFAFADDRERTLTALRTADPEFEAKVIHRAEQIIVRRFDLLGYREISIPDEIDWSLDPLTGVRAPHVHWSRIPFLDPKVAGDHKLVWELNRHQFLITLAQAWWITGNQRYASACDELLRSWMDANTPKRGINWASSLEVSYRSIAWLWTIALTGEALPGATRQRALGFLVVAGRHLTRYLSTYFSPNTHLTGEALGLYYLGTSLPQCRDARAWRDLGRRILLDCVDRHIRPDGVYVEPATWYHRYTVDIYTHFCILADRSGHSVGHATTAALERAIDYLAFVSRPDGTIPIVGDDDGGRLVPLDERSSADVRTPLGLGAVLFNRTDFAFLAGHASAEMVWLLGPGAVDRFNHMAAAKPPRASRAFADGGVYVMRDDWHSDASVLVVDAGPHGFLNGGHSHADALAIDLTVGGKPIFVDPGTFTYTLEPAWRDRFRSTASHSAVTVDGADSAVPSGPFSWSTVAQARSRSWFAGPVAVLFAGTHDGFEQLTPPVRYERAIVFLPPDLWIVLDTITGTQEREMRVHWQCAPDVAVTREDDTHVVLSVSTQRVQVLSAGGRPFEVSEGWVSPAYGVRNAAPHLSSAVRGREVSLATILCASDVAPEVARPSDAGITLGVRWGERRGVLATGSCPSLGLETDAQLAWVELDSDERPISVTATGLTKLALDGHALAVSGAGMTCTRTRDGWTTGFVSGAAGIVSPTTAHT